MTPSEKGAEFNYEWFDCVIKGPTQSSGDHVNVFPRVRTHNHHVTAAARQIAAMKLVASLS